jgi:hypothetical protein
MPKCPHCYKEIDHLVYVAKEWVSAEFSIVDGKPEYKKWDDGDIVDGTETFFCPECGGYITLYEDEAMDFLQGKSEDAD